MVGGVMDQRRLGVLVTRFVVKFNNFFIFDLNSQKVNVMVQTKHEEKIILTKPEIGANWKKFNFLQ
jgi:hypothetical protein